jgi:hypothetical protein
MTNSQSKTEGVLAPDINVENWPGMSFAGHDPPVGARALIAGGLRLLKGKAEGDRANHEPVSPTWRNVEAVITRDLRSGATY